MFLHSLVCVRCVHCMQFHGIQVGDVKDARLAARKAKGGGPKKKAGEPRLLDGDDAGPYSGGAGGGKSGCCCTIL